MVLGALVWFMLMWSLYWVSRRRIGQFLAALGPSTTSSLPDRRGGLGLGLIALTLAEGKLLSTPTGDDVIERLRRDAVWWRRWWVFVALPFFPVLVLAGAAINNLYGVSLDWLGRLDFRTGVLALLGVGVGFYALRWRGPNRKLAVALGIVAVAAIGGRIIGLW
jgi:hypothetical protein